LTTGNVGGIPFTGETTGKNILVFFYFCSSQRNTDYRHVNKHRRQNGKGALSTSVNNEQANNRFSEISEENQEGHNTDSDMQEERQVNGQDRCH